MITKEKLAELRRRLNNALPDPDEDGVYGDGSHESYARIFRRAYETADQVAWELLGILEDEPTDGAQQEEA